MTHTLAKLSVKSKSIRRAETVADLGSVAALVPREEAGADRKRRRQHRDRADPHAAAARTGDVHACWRMMEFDREVARRAGGQFVVVLESQATPGVAFAGSRCGWKASRSKGWWRRMNA